MGSFRLFRRLSGRRYETRGHHSARAGGCNEFIDRLDGALQLRSGLLIMQGLQGRVGPREGGHAVYLRNELCLKEKFFLAAELRTV